MRSLALICALSLFSATLVRADEKPKTDASETLPNPSKKYGWVGLGAAGACLLTGIVLGGVALGRSSEQNGDPNNPVVYTPDLHDRGREGLAMATAGYVLIGFGVVFAVVDVILWFEILRKPRSVTKTAALHPEKPSLRAAAGGLEVRF